MDMPARAYEIRQIERSVARARADIRDAIAPAQFRAAPAIKHAMPPQVVLQSEALDFSIVSANYVVTIFRCAHAGPVGGSVHALQIGALTCPGQPRIFSEKQRTYSTPQRVATRFLRSNSATTTTSSRCATIPAARSP